jgi:YidC/Oxa1 family membrane protein insertase
LWGWSSSTVNSSEVTKLHNLRPKSIPDGALGHDGKIMAEKLPEAPRSIPAISQTSDVPPQTSPTADPDAAPSELTTTTLDQSTSTAEEPPLSGVVDTAESLSSTSERIGYLKEVCGLDFGWGPTSLLEWSIEHIHIYGGLGWTMSIVLLAVLVRVVSFVPTLRSLSEGAKLRAARPVTTPIQAKIKECSRNQDYQGRAQAIQELKAVNAEYALKPRRMFYPLLVQLPLQFGGFRLLRNMADLPVPAFLEENWLWAPNLTHGDPFGVTPAANALLIYLAFKVCY